MTTEYILSSTARELADAHGFLDLWDELQARTPEGFDIASCFAGATDEMLDSKPDLTDAEALLHEWYDENNRPRPMGAETLAIIMTLYIAWQHAAYEQERRDALDER